MASGCATYLTKPAITLSACPGFGHGPQPELHEPLVGTVPLEPGHGSPHLCLSKDDTDHCDVLSSRGCVQKYPSVLGPLKQDEAGPQLPAEDGVLPLVGQPGP